MSKYKEGNLARDFSNVLDDIKGSFDLRIRSLGQTMGETHQTLDNFKKNRMEMAEDLKNFLKKYAGNIKKCNFERVKDFNEFFTELSKENSHAAKELKQFLKKYNLDRLSDFFSFIKPLQNDLKGMHEAFLGFANQMNQKRNKPFGLQIQPFSSMRAVASHREENPEVKSGQSFKVRPKTSHKGKKKGKR